MSTTKKLPKAVAVLGLSGITVPKLVLKTNLIIGKMAGNTNFPTPTPTLTLVTTQLNKLITAQDLVQTKVSGSAVAMHAEAKSLEVLLKQLAAYVAAIATSNFAEAAVIIESAGMNIRQQKALAGKTFSAKLGKTPGTVLLNTKAAARSSYLYEMTTDPSTAASWAQIAICQTVRFTQIGLTSGIRYYFRVAVITKAVPGLWSPVLNVIIP
jgi:hypothetical protein